MPVYEYECKEHGRFERFWQVIPKGSEATTCICPQCADVCTMVFSIAQHRVAAWFEVFANDGTLLHKTQTTARIVAPWDYNADNENRVEV